MREQSAVSKTYGGFAQQSVKNSLRLCFSVSLHYAFLFAFLLLAACIPAKVPDNLDDTPVPRFVVTDHTCESIRCIARYPDGWRIVTSELRTLPSVVCVARD